MRLVIAEKPSVAQSIAAVLGAKSRHDGYLEGGGYIVSWCFGHLAELADAAVYNADDAKWTLAALPIIPTSFRFIIRSDKQKQFDVLRELMRREDVTEVVNACDAGREGELIFRTVYCLAGCSKPILRLWISSMEDDAIRSGFQQLKSGRDYDGLHQSALCRAKADWLVGINATRYFSLTYGRTLNIGRVMSPTLALLVQREAEISAFVAEPFYTVQLDCGFPATTDRMKDRKDADAIANACKGKAVTVKSVERKEKSEKAPALYDLTSLQRDANRVLGYTSQQTLDYLQALYEKKFCTYPRTDSRFLTDDMEGSVPGLVAAAAAVCGMEKPQTICAKQVCSSKKVTDHHAIVPTVSAAKVDMASLPLGEREVLKLAAKGLLRAVDEPYRYAETVITLECAGQSFTAKGKTVLATGWKRYEQEPTEVAPALPVVTEQQMLKITSDGRKLGLDQRIINPMLPDEETTKVNQCVANILQYWRDGEEEKLTQLVFCDISTPKTTPSQRAAKASPGTLDSPEIHALESAISLEESAETPFTVYEDVRQKLIDAGMPPEQIAFIHDANTEVKKRELFAKVRSGQVRVLMGSTAKMGAGTNVQDRLVALHDLDCPWRPRDVGRILRTFKIKKNVEVTDNGKDNF